MKELTAVKSLQPTERRICEQHCQTAALVSLIKLMCPVHLSRLDGESIVGAVEEGGVDKATGEASAAKL